jgi:aminopeptidase-like protein
MKGISNAVRNLRNILAYCDGKLDLIDIFSKTEVGLEEGLEIISKLKQNNLITDIFELNDKQR